jgi:hypothetical protein
MKLRLFQRFHNTHCDAIMVRLKHNPLAFLLHKLENLHKNPDNMIHRVFVVIMKQDFVTRDKRCPRPGKFLGYG